MLQPLELVAVTSEQVSAVVALVSLALLYGEMQRRRRAEKREEAADERADRADDRARRAELRAERAERESKSAVLVVDRVRTISSDAGNFAVSLYVENVGMARARGVELVLGDSERRPIGQRHSVPGSIDPNASARNLHLHAQVAEPESYVVLGSWTDRTGAHTDQLLES